MSDTFAKITTEQSLAMDANSLNRLSRQARDSSPESIRGVAEQFEALFINMMMKSMRDATEQHNPFDSEQSKMFVSMLDQEVSQKMSQKGIGLADVLERQLSRYAKSTLTPEQLALDKGMAAGKTGLSLEASVSQGLPLNVKHDAMPLHRELKMERPEEVARKRTGNGFKLD